MTLIIIGNVMRVVLPAIQPIEVVAKVITCAGIVFIGFIVDALIHTQRCVVTVMRKSVCPGLMIPQSVVAFDPDKCSKIRKISFPILVGSEIKTRFLSIFFS